MSSLLIGLLESQNDRVLFCLLCARRVVPRAEKLLNTGAEPDMTKAFYRCMYNPSYKNQESSACITCINERTAVMPRWRQ